MNTSIIRVPPALAMQLSELLDQYRNREIDEAEYNRRVAEIQREVERKRNDGRTHKN